MFYAFLQLITYDNLDRSLTKTYLDFFLESEPEHVLVSQLAE